VPVLVMLSALDDLMCFWWCENNLCIVYGWIFGFACVRAGGICYARLSELFLAQTGSSRLSERGSNSPPLVSSARLSEGLSLERELEVLFVFNLAWAIDPCRLSESSLAWVRLAAQLFKCLYAPMIDLFTLLKHEIWCQRFIQRACVFLNFCCLGFCVFTCWN